MRELAQIVNQTGRAVGEAMIWGWEIENAGSERRPAADSYSIAVGDQKEQVKNVCIQNTNIVI